MNGPIPYAQFDKAAGGVVRLTRAAYRGTHQVDLRLYFEPAGDPGTWQPTRKGAAIPISDLPRLRAALEAMEVEALGEGLITDADYERAGVALPALLEDDA